MGEVCRWLLKLDGCASGGDYVVGSIQQMLGRDG